MKKVIWLIAIAGIFGVAWFWWQMRPVDGSSKKQIAVTIENGESLGLIAAKLEDFDLIRSVFAFKVYAKLSGVAGQLQAGTFIITQSQSLSEIIETLHSGKSQEFNVTIPEGSTVADIDALVAAKGLGKPGDILDCAFRCDFETFDFLPAKAAGSRELGYGSKLEGYLFPETYSVNPGEYVPKFLLERMLGEFRKRVVTTYEADINVSKRTLDEIVIMASLIEEESRHEEERPVISGILWKRLDNGVVLGVDAVNRYALGKKNEALTKTDLEADSAYNSRRRQGLPPSAIASAGDSAFAAALEPEESGWWYYLHGNDGVIRYAVTLDQHNQNKAKYLR